MGLELAKAYVTVATDSANVYRDLDQITGGVQSRLYSVSSLLGGTLSSVGAAFGHFGQSAASAVGSAFSFLSGNVTEASTNIENAINVTSSSFDLLGRAASVNGEKVVATFDSIKKSVLAVTGYVAWMTNSILSGGKQQATSFEQTQIAFETMLGGAEETKRTLADLTMFAAKTPFEMPEILQASRGLIQFGERGTELMETLNLLGNAASGTSTDFSTVALIFNQVRGVGKLLTQDFRQLSTRGVISLQDIANHYKVTTAAAQEMLSKGKVSFGDLKDIFRDMSKEGGRFANLMEKQSQSLFGLQSTLKDAVNILKRTIALPVAEWSKLWTKTMILLVEQVNKLAIRFPELAGGAIWGASMITKFTAACLAGGMAARYFGISLFTVSTAVKALKLAIIGGGLGVAITLIGAGLGALIPYLQNFGKHLLTLKPVQEALGRASDRMSEAWIRLKEAAKNVWNAIKPLIDKLLEMIGIDFSWIEGTASSALISVLDSVSTFVLSTATLLQQLTQDFNATWEMIKTAGTLAGSSILDVFSNTFSNIYTVGAATLDGLIAAFPIFVQTVSNHFAALVDVASNYFTVLYQVGRSTIDSIATLFTIGLKSAALMFQMLPKIAGAALIAIGEGVTGLIKVFFKAFGTITAVSQKSFQYIPTILGGVLMALGDVMTKFFSSIPKIIATAIKGGSVVDAMAEVMNDVSTGIAKAVSDSEASKAFDKEMALIGKGIEIVTAEANKIPDAIAAGWERAGGTKAITDVTYTIGELFDDATDVIAKNFSRPELVGAITDLGNSASGVVTNLIDGASGISSAFTGAFSGMSLKPLLEASDVTRSLADSLVGQWNKITGKVPALPPPAAEAEKKKTDKQAKKEPEKTLPSGKEDKDKRWGFAEYGKKLQDAVLGKQDLQKTIATETTKQTAIQGEIATNIKGALDESKKEKKSLKSDEMLTFEGVGSSITDSMNATGLIPGDKGLAMGTVSPRKTFGDFDRVNSKGDGSSPGIMVDAIASRDSFYSQQGTSDLLRKIIGRNRTEASNGGSSPGIMTDMSIAGRGSFYSQEGTSDILRKIIGKNQTASPSNSLELKNYVEATKQTQLLDKVVTAIGNINTGLN